MNFVRGLKRLFERKNEVEFSIEANSPNIEIGSIHEDNQWFHGEKFKVLSVSKVEHNPENHWKYTITGTCELLDN